MTTKNRVIERIARSKGSLKHHRKVVMALAAIVVFVTTYSLVLPAITLDEQEADRKKRPPKQSSFKTDGLAYEWPAVLLAPAFFL